MKSTEFHLKSAEFYERLLARNDNSNGFSRAETVHHHTLRFDESYTMKDWEKRDQM